MSYYAYMSDEAKPTFTMPLAGREVTFRRAGIGQVIMLNRTARKRLDEAENAPDTQRAEVTSRAMAKVLDFIESLIVDPADREFVEDQMLQGNIGWEELMSALSGGPSNEPADDEAPKPAKTAVKKSPRTAPAAKTVASRGRTKR